MYDYFKIIEDRNVLHRADTQGTVVTRIQKVLNTKTGEITTVRFWTNWTTGKLIRVE